MNEATGQYCGRIFEEAMARQFIKDFHEAQPITVHNRVKQNLDRLQLALGTGYAVTGWEYNSYFQPDVATVKRWSDGRVQRIPIEHDLLDDDQCWPAIAHCIHEQFYEAQPMTRPTEQQLNDPKWWRGSAPQSATHFACSIGRFVKQVGGVWQVYFPGYAKPWKPAETNIPKYSLIRRPTAPAWNGEGYPPAGVECEVRLFRTPLIGAFAWETVWRPCVVVGYDGDEVVVKHGGRYFSVKRDEIRPSELRARQRDDLIQTILAVGNQSEGVLADTLIADGWRKGDA